MASYPYFEPLPDVQSRRFTGCGFYVTVVGSAPAVLDWFEEVDLVGFYFTGEGEACWCGDIVGGVGGCLF